jgi:hypothetical protein
MENEIDNDLDIPIVEGAGRFNPDLYEGVRIPIAIVTKRQVIDFYPRTTDNPDGEFKADSTVMKTIIEIETAPLVEMKADETGYGVSTGKLIEMKQEDGTVKHITVKHRFNLQEITNEHGVKETVISKHPKALLWAFMRKQGVADLKSLKGKLVTLTSRPSSKEGDDRKYLKIVV